MEEPFCRGRAGDGRSISRLSAYPLAATRSRRRRGAWPRSRPPSSGRRRRRPGRRVEDPALVAEIVPARVGEYAAPEVLLAVGRVRKSRPPATCGVEDAAVGVDAAPVADLAAVGAAERRVDQTLAVPHPRARRDDLGVGQPPPGSGLEVERSGASHGRLLGAGVRDELVVEEDELPSAPHHGAIERRRERVWWKLAPGPGGRLEGEVRLLALLVTTAVRDDPVARLHDPGEGVEISWGRRQLLPAVVLDAVGEEGARGPRPPRAAGDPQVRGRADDEALRPFERDGRVGDRAPGTRLRIECGTVGERRDFRGDT